MSNQQELTDREKDVLKLIAEGGTSKQIGSKLKISSKTVEAHRNNIKKKYGIDSIAGLTRLAIRQGLIEA